MFVRKKKNASGSISIQIIQKVKGKYKVVKTLGSSFEEQEIEKIYRQAQEAIPHLFNQLNLFDKSVPPLNLNELSNESIRIIGPTLIFEKIFDYIGFNKIRDGIFKDLAISRITHPGSKLQLSEYLRENHDKDISVDAIYYFMDKLNTKYKEQVEEISFSYTKQLLNGKIGVVFYDMTTIYFESSQPDELRIPGFSKDGKHQQPQIFLGLLVGKNGYPIGYDIFEGNTYEGHTLIPFLERFQMRFSLDKPIVVADAGLLSKDNLEALKEKGYTFILGARIKNESKAITRQIKQKVLADGQIAEIQKEDSTTLFISYSEKRAKKDRSNRERGLKRLEKNLNAGRLTKSNINNRGYNKYLNMQGELKIAINYEKFEADNKWDGLKGYLTNTDLPGNEVIDEYNNLWKIEKAFRISKTDLKIRPIYHRLRERIEAHICISFVSFILYKELERVLMFCTNNISINTAIKQIKKMYGIRVQISGGIYQTVPLKNSPIQQTIIDTINAYF
jgi:transposase